MYLWFVSGLCGSLAKELKVDSEANSFCAVHTAQSSYSKLKQLLQTNSFLLYSLHFCPNPDRAGMVQFC